MYSLAETMNFSVSNSVFNSKINPPSVISSIETQGGSFYVKDNSLPIESTNNTFINNYVARTGSSFTLINSSLIDSSSLYERN